MIFTHFLVYRNIERIVPDYQYLLIVLQFYRATKRAYIAMNIAMNNDEQDVKKKIMMVVGACIFLIAAAQALPLFFGIAV